MLVLAGARIVYFTHGSFNAVVCFFDFTLWVIRNLIIARCSGSISQGELFVVDANGFRSTYLGVQPISFEPLPFFCSIVSIAVRS